jgi:hypothetical protein
MRAAGVVGGIGACSESHMGCVTRLCGRVRRWVARTCSDRRERFTSEPGARAIAGGGDTAACSGVPVFAHRRGMAQAERGRTGGDAGRGAPVPGACRIACTAARHHGVGQRGGAELRAAAAVGRAAARAGGGGALARGQPPRGCHGLARAAHRLAWAAPAAALPGAAGECDVAVRSAPLPPGSLRGRQRHAARRERRRRSVRWRVLDAWVRNLEPYTACSDRPNSVCCVPTVTPACGALLLHQPARRISGSCRRRAHPAGWPARHWRSSWRPTAVLHDLNVRIQRGERCPGYRHGTGFRPMAPISSARRKQAG